MKITAVAGAFCIFFCSSLVPVPAFTQPTLLPARAATKPVYNVLDYGATGDGRTLDSAAINSAIEACAHGGGGTVCFPAGTYVSGSLHLRSKIHLCLEAGAVLLGAPQNAGAYDAAEPFEGKAYQDGGHTYFHNSLIWGENLTDVSITGSGMINGGGLVANDKDIGQGALNFGDKAIALKSCRGVLFRDFTIVHGGHFAILATGCDNMTVDNVTVDTNRDGIDIDCCRGVMVSNCRINSPDDDGLCPKSSYALGEPVITENVTITNCQVSGFKEGTLLDGTMVPSKQRMGRIKFGTESNGGFRNITVSNCTFRCCRGLALEEVDGGVLENINISNITMMDVAKYPIYIRLGRRNRGPEGTQTGKVRNILISNVVATGVDAMSGIQITGIPGHRVEGVRLQNIRLMFNGGGTKKEAERQVPEDERGYPEPENVGVMPAYGIFARHVCDLELSDIRLGFEKPDLRPAMIFDDVDGLTIDRCKSQIADGVTRAQFDGVKGVVIHDSAGLETPPDPSLEKH